MSIQELKSKPSYEPLKRNGLSDNDIRKYYTLNIEQRKVFLRDFKSGKPQQTQSTQKCTVSNVNAMALELMEQDFEVQGNIFNMTKLGWSFQLSNHKTRFGQCSFRRIGYDKKLINKRLYLSQWLIENCDKDMDAWKNTMLHEIAHAIDAEIRKTTNHDYKWRTIALSIGCDGERCGTAKVDAKKSKYTLKCNNCGKETASHKRKKRISACGDCCRKYNGGRFTYDYQLEQIQNY